MLSRVLVAMQASMRIAVVSVTFAVVVGVAVGVVSGYRGGWLGRVPMRVVDVMVGFQVPVSYIHVSLATTPYR